MRTAVVALTKNGTQLALKLGLELGLELNADIFVKEEFMTEVLEGIKGKSPVNPVEDGFTQFAGKLFTGYDALVFIMACGIAVRALAPYVKDKRHDPAVVVLDEKGRHAISLLSGHIGGANSLARRIAEVTGGTPVITTSTDVNGVIAFDVFAVENDCVIENFGDLKYISSELVKGSKIGLYTDFRINGRISDYLIPYGNGNSEDLRYAVVLSNRTGIAVKAEKALYIRPRNLILGIGCRRGTTKEQIQSAVDDFMKANGKSPLSVKRAATIDLKENEAGLLEFCKERSLELCIIQRSKIEAVEKEYTYSGFVKEKAGVGSVAEPCAVMAGTNPRLICRKTVYKGITLALAEEEKEFQL